MASRVTIFSRIPQKPLPEAEDASAAPPPKKQRKTPSDSDDEMEIELTHGQKEGVSRMIGTAFELFRQVPDEERSEEEKSLLVFLSKLKTVADTDNNWDRNFGFGFVVDVAKCHDILCADAVKRLKNISERARFEAAIERNNTFIVRLLRGLSA
jgi:hypothetical protein